MLTQAECNVPELSKKDPISISKKKLDIYENIKKFSL